MQRTLTQAMRILAMSLIGSQLITGAAQGQGTWTKISAMSTPRDAHGAIRIGNDVLVIGGRTSPAGQTTQLTDDFNPSTAKFTRTGNMIDTRSFFPPVLLDSGKVLAAGGFRYSGGHYGTIAKSEVYNPSTRKWMSVSGGMLFAREQHSGTKLLSGQALFAGGFSNNLILNTAEYYDPATATFSLTGSMAAPRFGHGASLLANGRVLVTGGRTYNDVSLQTTELYDPVLGVWLPGQNMVEARFRHTATTLADGRILITGGYSLMRGATLASAEIYDPTTGVFTPVSSTMNDTRMDHTATLLANGRVLITGGWSSVKGSTVASADLFDPVTGKFTATASLPVSRHEQSAVALADGTVLLTGGLRWEPTVQQTLNDAYVYHP